MFISDQNGRIFLRPKGLSVINTRSEAHIKRYYSAMDKRAWCDDSEQRRRHILELDVKNKGSFCLENFLPLDIIFNALLENKDGGEISKLRKQISSLEDESSKKKYKQEVSTARGKTLSYKQNGKVKNSEKRRSSRRITAEGPLKSVINTRSEAQIKRYYSAIDKRAWCDDIEQRRRHILELDVKNSICLDMFLPLDITFGAPAEEKDSGGISRPTKQIDRSDGEVTRKKMKQELVTASTKKVPYKQNGKPKKSEKKPSTKASAEATGLTIKDEVKKPTEINTKKLPSDQKLPDKKPRDIPIHKPDLSNKKSLPAKVSVPAIRENVQVKDSDVKKLPKRKDIAENKLEKTVLDQTVPTDDAVLTKKPEQVKSPQLVPAKVEPEVKKPKKKVKPVPEQMQSMEEKPPEVQEKSKIKEKLVEAQQPLDAKPKKIETEKQTQLKGAASKVPVKAKPVTKPATEKDTKQEMVPKAAVVAAVEPKVREKLLEGKVPSTDGKQKKIETEKQMPVDGAASKVSVKAKPVTKSATEKDTKEEMVPKAAVVAAVEPKMQEKLFEGKVPSADGKQKKIESEKQMQVDGAASKVPVKAKPVTKSATEKDTKHEMVPKAAVEPKMQEKLFEGKIPSADKKPEKTETIKDTLKGAKTETVTKPIDRDIVKKVAKDVMASEQVAAKKEPKMQEKLFKDKEPSEMKLEAKQEAIVPKKEIVKVKSDPDVEKLPREKKVVDKKLKRIEPVEEVTKSVEAAVEIKPKIEEKSTEPEKTIFADEIKKELEPVKNIQIEAAGLQSKPDNVMMPEEKQMPYKKLEKEIEPVVVTPIEIELLEVVDSEHSDKLVKATKPLDIKEENLNVVEELPYEEETKSEMHISAEGEIEKIEVKDDEVVRKVESIEQVRFEVAPIEDELEIGHTSINESILEQDMPAIEFEEIDLIEQTPSEITVGMELELELIEKTLTETDVPLPDQSSLIIEKKVSDEKVIIEKPPVKWHKCSSKKCSQPIRRPLKVEPPLSEIVQKEKMHRKSIEKFPLRHICKALLFKKRRQTIRDTSDFSLKFLEKDLINSTIKHDNLIRLSVQNISKQTDQYLKKEKPIRNVRHSCDVSTLCKRYQTDNRNMKNLLTRYISAKFLGHKLEPELKRANTEMSRNRSSNFSSALNQAAPNYDKIFSEKANQKNDINIDARKESAGYKVSCRACRNRTPYNEAISSTCKHEDGSHRKIVCRKKLERFKDNIFCFKLTKSPTLNCCLVSFSNRCKTTQTTCCSLAKNLRALKMKNMKLSNNADNERLMKYQPEKVVGESLVPDLKNSTSRNESALVKQLIDDKVMQKSSYTIEQYHSGPNIIKNCSKLNRFLMYKHDIINLPLDTQTTPINSESQSKALLPHKHLNNIVLLALSGPTINWPQFQSELPPLTLTEAIYRQKYSANYLNLKKTKKFYTVNIHFTKNLLHLEIFTNKPELFMKNNCNIHFCKPTYDSDKLLLGSNQLINKKCRENEFTTDEFNIINAPAEARNCKKPNKEIIEYLAKFNKITVEMLVINSKHKNVKWSAIIKRGILYKTKLSRRDINV